MPTKSELLAANQQHLVRAIEHAGGFLTVAQVSFSLLLAHVHASRHALQAGDLTCFHPCQGLRSVPIVYFLHFPAC